MRITAWCAAGHERTEMREHWGNLTVVCPDCGASMTEEAIRRAIPEPYRPSRDLQGAVFQSLADYDIDVIVGPNMRPTVEYPRPA